LLQCDFAVEHWGNSMINLPPAQEWEHRIDKGDVEAALAGSDHVLEGDARMGGQVTLGLDIALNLRLYHILQASKLVREAM
jgi:xanthine dehydrogenase molybdopterin-binding subunit B